MTALPPMLFKYQSVTVQTLSNLRERVLWCAAPKDFNDPFDCSAAVAMRLAAQDYVDYHLAKGTPEAHEVARELAEGGAEAAERMADSFRISAQDAVNQQISENVHSRGVACLAAIPTDILMWSHYAAGHRGMCLGFRTDFSPLDRARAVEYQNAAPELHPIKLLKREISPEELAHILMLRKFSTWKYESEWRILAVRAHMALPYPAAALKVVYIGVETSPEHEALIRQVLAGTDTQVHRVRRAASGFAVEVDAP